MKKLRPRSVKWLSQVYTAINWWKGNLAQTVWLQSPCLYPNAMALQVCCLTLGEQILDSGDLDLEA